MRTSRKVVVTVALILVAAVGYGLYWGLFFVGGGGTAARLVEQARTFVLGSSPDEAAARKVFALEKEADRIQALQTMAGDEDARVRAFAASQIGAYVQAHPVLRAALERLARSDPDAAVREAAARALAGGSR